MAGSDGDYNHDPNDDSSYYESDDDDTRGFRRKDHAEQFKKVEKGGTDHDDDDNYDAKRKRSMRMGMNYSKDLDQMHVEKTDEQISKLRELKSNDESDFCNKITELLNDDNKKNNFLKNEKFHKLVEEYLLPTDSYRGIGVQFEEKDPNYPKKTTFRIGKVFKNTFASKIGLEEGDVIVLDEQNKMNIFELVTNLRKGKLNPVKEIVRDSKVILDKQELNNIDRSIDVTTEIDCKIDTGKFDSKITKEFSKTQKESIDKINKIVKTNKILPNLYDSLSNYLSKKQGIDAKSLEENIKKWAKINSINPNVERYSEEQSKEKSFLEIDTVAYLAEFMMSLSKCKLDVKDITLDDGVNLFKKSDEIMIPSSKIIYSTSDENKRVIIVTDNAYYSVFCEEKVGDEWKLLYWDAAGVCDPDKSSCILDDNYKEKVTKDKRLLNNINGNYFIVHDGTCGVGSAALTMTFLSGKNVQELKETNHIEYIEKFVRQNSTHQNPTPDPQTRSAQALCWQNYAQKIN